MSFAPVVQSLPVDQVLESLSAIVIGIDVNGSVSAWNGEAQRALGLARSEVLGRSLVELRLPLDESVVGKLLSASLGDRPVRVDDVKYLRSDGAEGLLGLTASPMAPTPDGRRPVLVLGRDITEHRLRDSQHMQSQKLEAIGQLAAGIAHEINTPTQYVTDNLHFLRDSFHDLLRVIEWLTALGLRAGSEEMPSGTAHDLLQLLREIEADYLIREVPRAIDQALEGTGRVAVIVRAMRGFSHPGQQDKAAADLNRAVRDTATVSTNEWRYSADLELDLEPELPFVVCQVGEISQVLLNLIVNASDAIKDSRRDESAPKGKIKIATRRDGDSVVIRVIDTGGGIPEKIRNRIFDPFFTTKPVGKGTGQGLSLARSIIVDKHRGSISVESELGVGSSFIVRLPLETA